jgi:hypothetical protein
MCEREWGIGGKGGERDKRREVNERESSSTSSPYIYMSSRSTEATTHQKPNPSMNLATQHPPDLSGPFSRPLAVHLPAGAPIGHVNLKTIEFIPCNSINRRSVLEQSLSSSHVSLSAASAIANSH